MSSDQGVTIRGADGKLYFVRGAAECTAQREPRAPARPAQALPPVTTNRHFVPVALCVIAENGEEGAPERTEKRAGVTFMPVALCLIAENGEGEAEAPEGTASSVRTFMPVALCIIADNGDGSGSETATGVVTKRARAA